MGAALRRQRTVRPLFCRSISRARASTSRCFITAGSDTANGLAISLTASHLPIVVQDMDDSPASRDFINSFRASITFHVVAWPPDKQPDEALTSNAARGALIIPEHFGRDMARGAGAQSLAVVTR